MMTFLRIPRNVLDDRRKRKLMRIWFHIRDDAYVTLWSVAVAIAFLIVFVIYLRERMPR